MSIFSNVRVTISNPFHESYSVHFTSGTIPLYEVFRSKDEAEFWAEKLKTGKWNPITETPNEALRNKLENTNE